MSVTVSLALAMRRMTREQLAGAATGRLRDDRLGDGHLLRQDRHADAEPDAGGAPELGRQSIRPRHSGMGTPEPGDRNRPGSTPARLDRPQRRRQLDRQPGGEGRQACRRSAIRPRAPCSCWLARARASTTPTLRRQYPAAVHDSLLVRAQADDLGGAPAATGWCRWSRGRRNGCWNTARTTRRPTAPCARGPRRHELRRWPWCAIVGAGDAHAGVRLRRAAGRHAGRRGRPARTARPVGERSRLRRLWPRSAIRCATTSRRRSRSAGGRASR